MRLNEVATQVKIIDGEGDKARSYYYWVTVAKPEKAMRAAKKKHRDRMGLVLDKDLTATIVNHSGKK